MSVTIEKLKKRFGGSAPMQLKVAVSLLFTLALLLIGFDSVKGQGSWGISKESSENFCTVCHSQMQVEYQESSHLRAGIHCADCHGGDPQAQTVEGGHAKDFRRALSRKQIVDLCSSCHADPAKMKPYGIPTDQHALYLTSSHGKKFLQGDNRVAICTDCHGAHAVLSPNQPKSATYRDNIPQTCGRCHGNAELLKGSNLSATVVTEYMEGVHGQALLKKHNRQAPECATCHGTHGAAPPGIGDVAKVCGQCHTKTFEAFRQSPHKTALAAAGQAECAACHGNHRIEPAKLDLWSSSCDQCHAQGSPQTTAGKTIQTLFAQAQAELDGAKQAIEQARQIPLDVRDYEARLSDATTYLLEARPLSHSLSVDTVEDLTRRARSIATETQSDIRGKVGDFRGRYLVLALIWFYIVISVAAIIRYRRARETGTAAGESE